jgi:hypothetical protein
MERRVGFDEFRFDTPQLAAGSFIEWKKLLLITGMLPLRAALDKSDAAHQLAEDVVGSLGPFCPYAVLFGLLVIFFINYLYHSHCCPSSAYGDHRPENLSQSGNIPLMF